VKYSTENSIGQEWLYGWAAPVVESVSHNIAS